MTCVPTLHRQACSFVSKLNIYRTQVSLVRSMGPEPPFGDLTDVSQADEDNNSIPTYDIWWSY